ncbi:MAG: sulfotransferase [Deltaproteobacteria bacterium]|nr:sulfotransferase [Deltaproteobacteria bacterium]
MTTTTTTTTKSGTQGARGKRDFRATFDELHEIAAGETGLCDFGDSAYRKNLEFLLDCYDRESIFGQAGRLATRQTLITALRGRLYSTHRLAHNPTALAKPILRPLIIAGLPRTGSTALHKLLAADPDSQALEYWLGCEPDSRPARSDWPSHPSYRAAVAALDRIYEGASEFRAAHSMKAGEADECRLLFMQDFLNVSFSFNATIPSYEAWVLEQEMRPAYARYRENLQLIGANESDKRWVLKNSSHLWALPALESTFPDVCLVQTHRNPIEWISSIASLVYKSRCRYEPDVRKRDVGEQQLDQWAKVIERSRADRAGLDCSVHDVHYQHFVRDPIDTIRRIYDRFELPWSPAAEKAIREWADQNRQDQHGVHRYSAAEYGLTEERIADRFSDYIEWEQSILQSG